MKLSIVIPSYNVEKYIEKCLLSCVHQDISLSEYEIIVVNDGSIDNSLLIAEAIAKKYSNISIINQTNQGLSAARNVGFNYASGEYVWFIDSDDWIEFNCLGELLNSCKNADVLCLSYKMFFEAGTNHKVVIPPITDRFEGKYLLNTRKFCIPAQFYIYKRQFLIDNKLTFYVGIYHEDMEFTPRMLYMAKSISICQKPFYYYYIRANSITTTINSKKSFDLIKVASSLHNFSLKVTEKECLISFSYLISMAINNALSLSNGYTKSEKEELNNKLSSNKILFKHFLSSPIIKNRLEGLLFTIMSKSCLNIYRILNYFKR